MTTQERTGIAKRQALEYWTATVRRREIERLSAARDADATAIDEIRSALATARSQTEMR